MPVLGISTTLPHRNSSTFGMHKLAFNATLKITSPLVSWMIHSSCCCFNYRVNIIWNSFGLILSLVIADCSSKLIRLSWPTPWGYLLILQPSSNKQGDPSCTYRLPTSRLLRCISRKSKVVFHLFFLDLARFNIFLWI